MDAPAPGGTAEPWRVDRRTFLKYGADVAGAAAAPALSG